VADTSAAVDKGELWDCGHGCCCNTQAQLLLLLDLVGPPNDSSLLPGTLNCAHGMGARCGGGTLGLKGLHEVARVPAEVCRIGRAGTPVANGSAVLDAACTAGGTPVPPECSTAGDACCCCCGSGGICTCGVQLPMPELATAVAAAAGPQECGTGGVGCVCCCGCCCSCCCGCCCCSCCCCGCLSAAAGACVSCCGDGGTAGFCPSEESGVGAGVRVPSVGEVSSAGNCRCCRGEAGARDANTAQLLLLLLDGPRLRGEDGAGVAEGEAACVGVAINMATVRGDGGDGRNSGAEEVRPCASNVCMVLWRPSGQSFAATVAAASMQKLSSPAGSPCLELPREQAAGDEGAVPIDGFAVGADPSLAWALPLGHGERLAIGGVLAPGGVLKNSEFFRLARTGTKRVSAARRRPHMLPPGIGGGRVASGSASGTAVATATSAGAAAGALVGSGEQRRRNELSLASLAAGEATTARASCCGHPASPGGTPEPGPSAS